MLAVFLALAAAGCFSGSDYAAGLASRGADATNRMRTGPALSEELVLLGAEVAYQRDHRRGRVAEALGRLRRAGALHEVRAQRLIATLRDPFWRGEEPSQRAATLTTTLTTGASRLTHHLKR